MQLAKERRNVISQKHTCAHGQIEPIGGSGRAEAGEAQLGACLFADPGRRALRRMKYAS